ncbi:hypothetical protein F5B22DRAFT_645239 [Xylaria bambusicola]|uniref:uncharacterized protein n=1 Tax=Xylaria bambusicola TaxID=326684 RepID=UPI0020077014|nr:uncharacterized protein F5B22DRAFT_645239 [Xylaria bambusicola]KAI0517992.1 hypothetical protein F5B22DRAFT_645239 [Xylaria bambusicola]
MGSQPRESLPVTGLPMELIEQVANEILTTKTLANFTRTCSTAKRIVERNPLQFYLTDIRFQKLRKSDPEIRRQFSPMIPSLVHAIQHENLDNFKKILKLYQKKLSRKIIDTWPTDENGGVLSPTAYEAVLTAERFDIFVHMATAGCGFTYDEYTKVVTHQFYYMLKDGLRERLVAFMLIPDYSASPPTVHHTWYQLPIR